MAMTRSSSCLNSVPWLTVEYGQPGHIRAAGSNFCLSFLPYISLVSLPCSLRRSIVLRASGGPYCACRQDRGRPAVHIGGREIVRYVLTWERSAAGWDEEGVSVVRVLCVSVVLALCMFNMCVCCVLCVRCPCTSFRCPVLSGVDRFKLHHFHHFHHFHPFHRFHYLLFSSISSLFSTFIIFIMISFHHLAIIFIGARGRCILGGFESRHRCRHDYHWKQRKRNQ